GARVPHLPQNASPASRAPPHALQDRSIEGERVAVRDATHSEHRWTICPWNSRGTRVVVARPQIPHRIGPRWTAASTIRMSSRAAARPAGAGVDECAGAFPLRPPGLLVLLEVGDVAGADVEVDDLHLIVDVEHRLPALPLHLGPL